MNTYLSSVLVRDSLELARRAGKFLPDLVRKFDYCDKIANTETKTHRNVVYSYIISTREEDEEAEDKKVENKNERRLPATWETRHPHSASRGCIVLAGGGLDTCAASSVLIIQLRRYWMKRVEVYRIVSAVLIATRETVGQVGQYGETCYYATRVTFLCATHDQA